MIVRAARAADSGTRVDSETVAEAAVLIVRGVTGRLTVAAVSPGRRYPTTWQPRISIPRCGVTC